MSYPNTWPAFNAALQSYTPSEDVADAIAEAYTLPNVPRLVAVYDALKGLEIIDSDTRSLLMGAAQMIASHGFFGKAADAVETIARLTEEV